MTDGDSKTPQGGAPFLRQKFLRNAAWSTALRWTVKTIGFGSTVCLARLLTPADFGLVAMAMIVLSFLDAWSDIGVQYALIHNPKPSIASYNTAWTLRLLQGIVVAVLIAVIAPFAAMYFREPRVTLLLWVLSAAPVITSLRNIGVIDFRKELRLEKEFKLLVTSKLLSVAGTIVCAWYLRNFWALVFGILSGTLIEVIGSYIIHPFRPRLSLVEARSFRGYWFATLANGVGHFTEAKLDEILVGRYGSTSTMGVYSLASEFGQLPVTELAAPLNKTLVPTMSLLQLETGRLRTAFLNYVQALAFLIVPACVGLALVSHSFLRVVLGEQWTGGALVMQILALFAILRSGILAIANALVGLGRPMVSAQLAWINVVLLLAGGLALAPQYGVSGIAFARLAGGFCVALFAGYTVGKVLNCPLGALLRCYARPLLCAAVMAIPVMAVSRIGLHPFVELAAQIAVGAAVYVATSLLVWHRLGRPDGGERLLFEQLDRIRRLRPAQ